MEVFVVIGGWNYDGEHGPSARVFTDRELAEDYSKEITLPSGTGYSQYDYAQIHQVPLWSLAVYGEGK